MGHREIALSIVTVLLLTVASIGQPQQTDEAIEMTLLDSRDGQRYLTIVLADMVWLAQDLNYEAPESFCYDDLEENCRLYGRLYRWESAVSSCPVGWHLATEYEWQALERWLGMDEEYLENYGNRGTEQAMRLKQGGDTGFNATYGGWRRSEDGAYEALGEHAAYWEGTDSSFDRAWHRDIDVDDDMIWRSPVIKPYALSVRCVKNQFQTDDNADSDMEASGAARKWL